MSFNKCTDHNEVAFDPPMVTRRHQASVVIPILAFVMFTIPFGHLLGVFLGGLTVSKIVLPILFLLLLVNNGGQLTIPKDLILLVAFIFFTMPSFLTSDIYSGLFVSLVGYTILFAVVGNVRFTVLSLRNLLYAFSMGLFFVALAAITAYLTGFDLGKLFDLPMVEYWYGTPTMLGTAVNPNGFASFFIVGIPAIVLFFLTTNQIYKKVLFAGIGLVLAVALLMTYSRSAMLGTAVGSVIVMHFYFSKSKTTWSLALKLIFLFGLAYGGLSAFQEIVKYFSTAEVANFSVTIASNKSLSAGYRLLVLGPLLSLLTINPLFGIGYGNIPDLLQQAIGLRINSHNIFLGIVIEFGLVAFLLFVLLIFSSGRAMLLAINRTFSLVNRATFGCYFGILCGLLVHGVFHEIYINFTLWFFIAFGSVIKKIALNSNISPSTGAVRLKRSGP